LASRFATTGRSFYGASKAAVDQFLKVLRVEEPDIQVTIVNPGFVVTEMLERAYTPKQIEGSKSDFMTSDVCAQQIIDAARNGKREELLTPLAKVGEYIQLFFPSLTDYMASKKGEPVAKKNE